MKIKIIIPINNSDFNDEIALAVEPVLTADMTVDVANISEGNRCIESRYDSEISPKSPSKLFSASPTYLIK
ncbi:MAG: hypothetical protein F6K47_36295 [Symploca sp. SIO2E6]|nr:hypothetical protein [Symploca sp. SIO2E6]